ncbi:Hypothetical protein ADU72_0024 (plasmid) [Pediococcus damnosus]|uniref:Uncharacterized protein n=1 Tax=Pediococcus damnosus TaxID=51663 RepID=A0AAC9B3R3_9LACO|nr:Hypothetical protein ADU70_0284 [Pediococcus damnosus]AMV68180.1 Hypothetical protein ADU72_0024 [Pediococcus damnosus]
MVPVIIPVFGMLTGAGLSETSSLLIHVSAPLKSHDYSQAGNSHGFCVV